MGAAEKVVTTKLEGSLVDRLEETAERLERTKSWIVREALAEWLGEEEHRHRLTLEALKSVDEGRVIEHREVQRRAATLKRKARARLTA